MNVLSSSFASQQARLFERDKRRSREITLDETGWRALVHPLQQAASVIAPELYDERSETKGSRSQRQANEEQANDEPKQETRSEIGGISVFEMASPIFAKPRGRIAVAKMKI